MMRKEIAVAAAWFGGALLIVTSVGYGIYRAGRRIVRSRTKAGAR